MFVDTKSLKKIIRDELDKRNAEHKKMQFDLERLEELQLSLRHNLEQISFVEDLACSLKTVVSKGKVLPKVYHVAPCEPSNEEGAVVLVPEGGAVSSEDLITRLMEDELRHFSRDRRADS